jgi:hypothetical protein
MSVSEEKLKAIVDVLVRNEELATRIFSAVNEAAEKEGVTPPVDPRTFWAVLSRFESYALSEPGPLRYFV